jgi:hypothetical protein
VYGCRDPCQSAKEKTRVSSPRDAGYDTTTVQEQGNILNISSSLLPSQIAQHHECYLAPQDNHSKYTSDLLADPVLPVLRAHHRHAEHVLTCNHT